MEVEQLAPGLWRWTATDWDNRGGDNRGGDTRGGAGGEVGCFFSELEGRICLFDPVVSLDEAERFTAALERDLERARRVDLLVTSRSKAARARGLAGRYGAALWVPAEGGEPFPRDALPGGIHAYRAGDAGCVVYWIPEHRALVAGDALTTAAGGTLSLSAGIEARPLLPLLDLDIDRVLVAHGQPLLAGGRRALQALLDA